MLRSDAANYLALYMSLYQAQVDLEAQSACPQGHPFAEGFTVEEGQVANIHLNINVTPKGRVTCRICAAGRAAESRRGRDAR